MRIFNVLSFLFLIGWSASAQNARLVADLAPGAESFFNGAAERIVAAVGDRILFTQIEGDNHQLWSSDGTEAGTFPIQENQYYESYAEGFVQDDTHVYFTTFRPPFGYWLWRTDGLTVDTLLNRPKKIRRLTPHQGLLFCASEAESGPDVELIRVDPQSRESEAIASFFFFGGVAALGSFNDRLFIIGAQPDARRLFLSDGTAEGTTPYFEINRGNEYGRIPNPTVLGDRLVFFYESDFEGLHLWSTDGTAENTFTLAPLQLTASFGDEDTGVLKWNDRLYFRAAPRGGSQTNLLATDGTPQGTRSLTHEYYALNPSFLTPYRGRLYFRGDEGGLLFNLFRTDSLLTSIEKAVDDTQLGGGISFGGEHLAVYHDLLYFAADRHETGYELWESDGTTAGTRCLDLVPGASSSLPRDLIVAGGRLFFTLETPEHGRELWVLQTDIPSPANYAALAGESWTAHPNPTAGPLRLDLDNITAKIDRLRLRDARGQTLLQWPGNIREIDISDLPAGVYVLEIESGGRRSGRRVVKSGVE